MIRTGTLQQNGGTSQTTEELRAIFVPETVGLNQVIEDSVSFARTSMDR